ncbi:nucleotide-diphospho-sugar transferase [Rhodocytophaga aerolata]
MFYTPILFMIFNRPDTTAKVFEEIRKVKPKYLFIAADGPRADRQGEIERCEQTRRVATQIDWPCQVKTLFRDKNMGCGLAPAENITWFFTHVEEGIILEDDCVPHPSFFGFCENLLSHYRDNLKVFQISGDNFQHGQTRGKASYYFSKYTHICGWATWRSRWQYYDFYLSKAEEYKRTMLIEKKCRHKSEVAFWHRKLEMLSGGKRKDMWDYQWMFACWNMNGLSAVSNVNLISNIGFGSEATHTVNIDLKVANLTVYEIGTIVHAQKVEANEQADFYTFFKSGAFFLPSLIDKIRWKIKSVLPENIRLLISKI